MTTQDSPKQRRAPWKEIVEEVFSIARSRSLSTAMIFTLVQIHFPGPVNRNQYWRAAVVKALQDHPRMELLWRFHPPAHRG